MTLVQRTLRGRTNRGAQTGAAKESEAADRPKADEGVKSIWAEQFIGKYFLRMPPAVRIGVYLLLVAVYVHNTLQESILMGQLWIRHENGKEEQAANYVIQTWTPYATNAEGRWALPAGRRLPLGSIEAEILTNDREPVGTTKLCLPIPIIGPMLGSPHYRIVYDESTRTVTTKATPRCGSLSGLFATVLAAEQSSMRAAPQRPRPLYVTVRELTLRNTGHVDKPAEIYLRLYVNGRELRPRGFPSREQEGTWLLLVDGKTAALNNLTFTIPVADPKLLIELWDRDRSVASVFKAQDNRVAAVGYEVRRDEIGTRVLSDRGGTTLTLELHR